MINLLSIIEQIEKSKLAQKIDSTKIKNPDTGRTNKLSSALANKDSGAHEKAIEMLKKIKLQFQGNDKSHNANSEYINSVVKTLKNLKEKPDKIKAQLDKSKNKDEFIKNFRKSIDPSGDVFSDRILNMSYTIWKKNQSTNKDSDKKSDWKKYSSENDSEKTKSKSKDTKKVKDFYDDADYDTQDKYSNDEDTKEELSKLNKKDALAIIAIGTMFGGVGSVFNLSKGFFKHYLDKLKDDFSDKSQKVKDLFNFDER